MADLSWPDRASLVAAARNNDEAAYQALFDPLWRLARSRAWTILGNVQDAEEVAQDCLLKLFRYLPTLPNTENIDGWVNRVATNAAIDRKRRRRSEGPPDDATVVADNRPSPAALAASKEGIRQLHECLKTLPLDLRKAVVLRKMHGRSNQEIADILEANINTIAVHVHRGLKRLKECLARG